MKVAVYAICKNEAKHIDRFLSSCREADYIVIGDTGSTDDSWPILTSEAGIAWSKIKVFKLHVEPFRFDDARNAVLAQVPADADMCIAMDMDEIMELGWRDRIENAFAHGATNVSCTFKFTTIPSFLQNNRIHSRHGWRWKYPAHEALVSSMQREVVRWCEPDLVMSHLPDETKPRCYLNQLAWGEFEYPQDARMAFYYARELMFFGYYTLAAEKFSKSILHDCFEKGEAIRLRDFCLKQLQAGDQMKSQSCSPEKPAA